MSFLPILAVGAGVSLYYYVYRSPTTAPNPEPALVPEPVPIKSTHVSSGLTGPATLASSLSSNPGTYVPIGDADRSLYETQVKHLSIASRFAYG